MTANESLLFVIDPSEEIIVNEDGSIVVFATLVDNDEATSPTQRNAAVLEGIEEALR